MKDIEFVDVVRETEMMAFDSEVQTSYTEKLCETALKASEDVDKTVSVYIECMREREAEL